jgi:hypothetical protein
MNDLDSLAVEEEILVAVDERIRRPGRERRRRLRTAQAQGTFSWRSRRPFARIADRARHVAAGNRAAGGRNDGVAADTRRRLIWSSP